MKRCMACYKHVEDDKDRIDTLKHYLPGIELPEEYAVHSECMDAYIHKEKVEVYKKVLKPVFDKLNKSQITRYDVKAIAEAFSCEHRFLQSEMINIIRQIIEEIGKKFNDPGYIDARNQQALEWCWKAVQV